MKLANIQFEFLSEGNGLKCCRPGSSRALARIVPDQTYPSMWRVVRANGSLSDMVNKARARDAAWGIAESRVFTGDRRNAA
jgi:hypothetical protein